MWDAILSSVPQQPEAPRPSTDATRSPEDAASRVGDCAFSPFGSVRVTASGGKLFAQATGACVRHREVRPGRALHVSGSEYKIPGRYPLGVYMVREGLFAGSARTGPWTLRFVAPDRLVLNPGHWQRVGLLQALR